MMLITEQEEEKLCKTIVEYYKKLYPGIHFEIKEAVLHKDEIGDIEYTFPGEESEITAKTVEHAIAQAVPKGYKTHVILLKKKDKLILLDGHRRLKVAFDE